ncbi:DinB family protein [Ichthyenterobacterium magnum]|uniref:Uncharacterized protein DUF1572 n=1 Tax=Ichthyenterobacterium magnum TaxID=1230530 RepID=A0A420DKL0_9FLAO|nr:DUF1572 family protein [Ichthyenterobacterium magnum]RKE94772.1 uncharacterized protein DUF1572 [Ichthyenterobacterium magnum]
MLNQTLIKLFTRDLNKLKIEIQTYNDESTIWMTTENISNSAGNLALHLVGNLNHFIGATIGKTGYIRERDLEFSLKNIPRDTILEQIDDTIHVITKALKSLSSEDLQKEYKRRSFEDYMTTEYFLVHLTTHLSYHLGQINYHRRLLDV